MWKRDRPQAASRSGASGAVGSGLPVGPCGKVDEWSCWFLISGFKFDFGISAIRNEQLETRNLKRLNQIRFAKYAGWDCCLTVLVGLCAVVSLQRVGDRCVCHEGWARDTIPFRCPGAEVGHLTSFRTEGVPRVAFPGAGLVTEGTGHARHYTMVNTRIGQRSTLADLGRSGDLQQPVQMALIDLREAEEFDSKLPTLTPTDRGGLDRNGRTQIGRPDEYSHC